jgi:hypothetical protein
LIYTYHLVINWETDEITDESMASKKNKKKQRNVDQ